MELSVIIPCYNSSSTISTLVDKLTALLAKDAPAFEIILVYDCSKDGTWEVLEKLTEKNPHVIAVELGRNVGQQSAVMCGFEYATGKYIVTMDDDLQHDPEHIRSMIDFLESEDLDIVIAELKREGNRSALREFGTQVVWFLSHNILKLDEQLQFSSFRVIRKEVAKRAMELNSPDPVVGYALLSVSHKCKNYPIPYVGSAKETSTYSFFALLKYFLNMLFNHSILPLQYIMALSMVFVLVSFLLAAYYLLQYVLGNVSVTGFTTLVFLITFLFGMVFSVLGIMSSYLLYNIKTSMRAPKYYARKVVKSGSKIGSAD